MVMTKMFPWIEMDRTERKTVPALLLMEVVTIQEWYTWCQEVMVSYADYMET